MGLIGTLNTAVAGNVISASEYNQNMTAIRTAFNDSAVLMDVARTIVAQHTFAPASAQAPFVLGANAQNQLVTGLYASLAANAENLNGQAEAFYRNAGNLNAGTIPSGRLSGSYTGITAVGTIATGTWQGTAIANAYLASLDAAKLTGTVASARISGSYTGITGVGTLSAGSIPASLLTGTIASARLSGAYTGITELGGLTSATITTLTATNLIVGGSGATITGIRHTAIDSINLGSSVASMATVYTTQTVSGAAPGDIVHVVIRNTSGFLDPGTRGFVTNGIVSASGTVAISITNLHTSTANMSDIDLDILVIKV